MKIWIDVVSGDEVCADSFPHKLVDDLYYEVDCKKITVNNGIDESLIGGNASAEEAAEGAEDGAITELDVVFSHRLVSTQFDKKSYTAYIKGYMKSIKEYLEKNKPERVAVFTKGMPEVIKRILGQFDQYEFYTGEKMDPDGLVLLLNYREDGITPFFTIWKDGIREEKV